MKKRVDRRGVVDGVTAILIVMLLLWHICYDVLIYRIYVSVDSRTSNQSTSLPRLFVCGSLLWRRLIAESGKRSSEKV